MKKYRPSSGTEGMHFQDKFCEKCKHKNLQEVFPVKYVKNCEILISTQCYDVDEPEYPSEWVYDPDGNPTCTKFEKMEIGNNQNQKKLQE